MSFFQSRIAAAAMMAALALPVLAQPAPSAVSAPPAATASAEQARTPGDRQERRQAYMAKRAEAFKAQLKLTPEQEPAWTAFMAAMQPAERTARLDRADMEKRTTPERIDRMRALRAQYAAEADRRGEATKTFYAALTPEQQKTFDARAQQMHRKDGWRGHHGDGGHGHGEHGHHGMRGGEMPMGAPGR